eukprot:TRINITY_DN62_c0_g1_i8.p3 TRINITY_DN62_c0_g1~~TRINITY_DN62_c0_g1_i8.p3  ORF type:complete len:202 (+),score=-17.76 TRINITY_DN62_c0_g1_i8:1669-2274(+)
MTPQPKQCSTPEGKTRRTTQIVFGENQLSPGLISLSLRSTGHPLIFQNQSVRSSSQCYLTFNLPMDRSPGFGSIASDSTPYQDSISLRLPQSVNLATNNKSLTHYTKGTPSRRSAPTACMHTVSGSISLPSQGFFSPFPHGTGSLSVSWEYLALEDGPPIFSQDVTCPDLLNMQLLNLRVRGYHPVSPDFPDCSTNSIIIG